MNHRYPGDITDPYDPDLDTDPLCCCEYYDRNSARNHILACCCNCTDVDESFDSLYLEPRRDRSILLVLLYKRVGE